MISSTCAQGASSPLFVVSAAPYRGCVQKIWRAVQRFFAWMFCLRSERAYHREDLAGRAIEYCLLEKGRPTGNRIRFSQPVARLEKLSGTISRNALHSILEKEHIQAVQVGTLHDARLLYGLGMRTESIFQVSLVDPESVFTQLVAKAMEKRSELGGEVQVAIEAIEIQLIKALISEALPLFSHYTNELQDQQIFSLGEDLYALGIRQILRVFPSFNGAGAIARAREGEESEVLLRAYAAIEENLEAQTQREPQEIEMELKIDVPLETLFRFLDELDEQAPRMLLSHTAQFTKRGGFTTRG